MKPSDIYKLPSLNNERARWMDIQVQLANGWHDHLPELKGVLDFSSPESDVVPTDRLQIKLHIDPYIDGERCCTIGSVWFDQKPIMIFRHAGRSGHDECDRFITDFPLFKQMIALLRDLLPPDEEESRDVCDPNMDLPDLDFFYGDSMEDLLKRSDK